MFITNTKVMVIKKDNNIIRMKTTITKEYRITTKNMPFLASMFVRLKKTIEPKNAQKHVQTYPFAVPGNSVPASGPVHAPPAGWAVRPPGGSKQTCDLPWRNLKRHSHGCGHLD